MTTTPHIAVDSPDFPGDPTPQLPFDFIDAVRQAVEQCFQFLDLLWGNLGVEFHHHDMRNHDHILFCW